MLAIVFSFTLVIPDVSHSKVFAAEKNSYSLDTKTVTVYIGENVKQKLYNKEGNAVKAEKITWKSNNRSVAKISEDGKITGIKKGETKMYAKYKGVKYEFAVKVKSSPFKLSKSTVKFSSTNKSAKVKITTKYDNLVCEVVSGDSVVSCSWGKKWIGNSIYLHLECNEPGTAKIKVYAKGHSNKYRYINVTYGGYTSELPKDTTFKVSKPSIPYTVDESLLHELHLSVNELKCEKLYNRKTGKYAISCNASGYINYTGLHIVSLTLYDSNGDEVKSTSLYYSSSYYFGKYSHEYDLIDLYLYVDDLPEGSYTLELNPL